MKGICLLSHRPEETHGAHKGHVEDDGHCNADVVAIPGNGISTMQRRNRGEYSSGMLSKPRQTYRDRY